MSEGTGGGLELVVEGSEGAGARCPVVPGTEVVLGRDPGCDLVLDRRFVSKRHARLSWEGSRAVLEDLGSACGTRLNGRELGRARLRPGDRIEIKDLVLGVHALPGPLGLAPPSTAGAPRLLSALEALVSGDGEELSEGLDPMLGELVLAFEADRGAVFVPGPDSDGLSPLCVRGRMQADPVSQGLLSRVAGGDEILLESARGTDALRRDHASIAAGLGSIMAAPVPLPEGRGVVYLDTRSGARRFTEVDRQLLEGFARAASAMLRRDHRRRRQLRARARLVEVQNRALAAEELLGDSPAMAAVRAEIARVAPTPAAVLVEGESGTGKELAARALHRASTRADGPFVPVNSAAIPAELLESELFGHAKGAFSGADRDREGRFELADGGTLFLDEVGELPAAAQAKLLRALQERRVARVGGREEIPVDFRLVAATNVDLEGAVSAGEFRQDLFFRLAVFRLRMPPLREREGDPALLAEAFLRSLAREYRLPVLGISEAVRAALGEEEWPGNVRQLRNVIEQAVIRETGDWLRPGSVFPALGRPLTSGSEPSAPGQEGGDRVDLSRIEGELTEAKRELERRLLVHRLRIHGGNVSRTAGSLGIARKNLYAKLKDLGLDPASFR